MKKLNRKGFTLVELLAVIVILAIVVGITLVTVLPTLKESRQDAFALTAQTAADYLEKEYQLYVVGQTSNIPSDIMTAFDDLTAGTKTSIQFTASTLKAAGLKNGNYVIGANSTWKLNKTSGRICVKLKAATRTWAESGTGRTAGEYYDVDPDIASSTGC